jgi:hypothetical protein
MIPTITQIIMKILANSSLTSIMTIADMTTPEKQPIAITRARFFNRRLKSWLGVRNICEPPFGKNKITYIIPQRPYKVKKHKDLESVRRKK